MIVIPMGMNTKPIYAQVVEILKIGKQPMKPTNEIVVEHCTPLGMGGTIIGLAEAVATPTARTNAATTVKTSFFGFMMNHLETI